MIKKPRSAEPELQAQAEGQDPPPGVQFNPPPPPPPRAAPTNGNGNSHWPSPRAGQTRVWPIPGDVPDLESIIADQAATMAAQAKMIDDYQAVLAAAQAPVPQTPASGNIVATANSNQITVTDLVTGTIVNGALLAAASLVPANTTVLGQISGTLGGNGVYLVSQSLPNISVPLATTFTPPPVASTWPPPTDAPTLMTVVEDQTSVLRIQMALLQQYQALLNDSQTPPPTTGP